MNRLLGPRADHVRQGLVPGDEEVRPTDDLGALKHVPTLHVSEGEPAHTEALGGWGGRGMALGKEREGERRREEGGEV